MDRLIERLFSYISILTVIIIGFISCNKTQKENEIENIVEQFIGDTILLPVIDSVLLNDSVYQRDFLYKSKLKITTFIQGDCPICVDELEKWNDLYQYSKSEKDLKIYFFTSIPDIYHFKENFYKDNIHKYPLLLDNEYAYIDKNNLTLHKKTYQTFLSDSANKIILVGNPIYNNEIYDLYITEIKNRLLN